MDDEAMFAEARPIAGNETVGLLRYIAAQNERIQDALRRLESRQQPEPEADEKGGGT